MAWIGVFSVLTFLVMVGRFWHPVYGFTKFIQLDSSNDEVKIDAFKKLPIYVYRDTGGYDGLYYAEIAYDPLLRSAEIQPAVDNVYYRARRILGSALAWLLALGNPNGIVHVYSLLNVAAWLILAPIAWSLLRGHEWRGLLAWLGVMFSAGSLGSVRFALTDLIALTIMAGAFLAAEKLRSKSATGLLALSLLARETALLGIVGILDRPWLTLRNFLRAVLVMVPLALWVIYLRQHSSVIESGSGNFTLPLAGVIEKWRDALLQVRHGQPEYAGLAWTALMALIGISAQALYFIVRWDPRDRWWHIGAAFTVMLCFLGTPVWLGFPGAAYRVLLPLTLAFNVSATRARVHLAWILIGNATVFAGIQHLADVPYDTQEIAAAHLGQTRYAGNLRGGWFGVEHTSRHQWSWSSGRGLIRFESWPGSTAPLKLTLALRSLKPCHVTISQAGVELWRGSVGASLNQVEISFTPTSRKTDLEFVSDEPPLPEGDGNSGRQLAFAVYDMKISPATSSR